MLKVKLEEQAEQWQLRRKNREITAYCVGDSLNRICRVKTRNNHSQPP
jgi:hypothetical protein